jgi:hypothetical protein
MNGVIMMMKEGDDCEVREKKNETGKEFHLVACVIDLKSSAWKPPMACIDYHVEKERD